MRRISCAFALVATTVATSASGMDAEAAVSAYESLWRGRFASASAALSEEGLAFASDVARWRLFDGELRAMEPLADGRVAGCVFRGRGRFSIPLPDARERAHFARMSGSPERDPVVVDFTEMVLRSADGLCERLAGAPIGPYSPDSLAEERRRIWIERGFYDVEAAMVRGLLGDAPGLLVAEMRTAEHGWLLYTFDPDLREEIGLAAFHPDEKVYEAWVSLDRAADRRPDGRPGTFHAPQLDLVDVEIEADLRQPSRFAKAGRARILPRRARFEAKLRLRPLRPGLRSLALVLDPFAEPVSVRDEGGRELRFLRDHVGERRSALPPEVWDDGWLILLDEPLGERERTLTFVWERDIVNSVGGRSWYPGEHYADRDLHTASVAVVALPKHDVRGMGSLVEKRESAEGKRVRWRVDRPVRAVTFSFAERFEEARVGGARRPEVKAFRARGGGQSAVRGVAEDVAEAWTFFESRFGPGPATDTVWVTSIVGEHGQAFEGFLQLPEETFGNESRGPTELLRAHETAHQWWGHLVGWDSDRDLWLAEGFAHFSALLFVEATVEDGEELYREAVESWAALAMGESKPSRMHRRFSPPRNRERWSRVGPIALGRRAATAEIGAGYPIQIYFKGALVLHMLRALLRERSGSDELLFGVLADFAREFRGRQASTGDFVATLGRRVPDDWDWFFRQWLDETAIPSWEWSWRPAAAADGGSAVTLEIAQSDAPPGFRMPVPVEVELAGGERLRTVVLVDEANEVQTLALPAPARDVALDPEWAVLARRRER